MHARHVQQEQSREEENSVREASLLHTDSKPSQHLRVGSGSYKMPYKLWPRNDRTVTQECTGEKTADFLVDVSEHRWTHKMSFAWQQFGNTCNLRHTQIATLDTDIRRQRTHSRSLSASGGFGGGLRPLQGRRRVGKQHATPCAE